MNNRVSFSIAIVLGVLVLVGLISGALLLFYSDSLFLGVLITFASGALITVFIFLLIAFGVEAPEKVDPSVAKVSKKGKSKGRPRRGTFMAVRGQIFKESKPTGGAIFDRDKKR